MPRNRFSFRNNSLQLTPMAFVQVVKLFRGYQSYPTFGVTLIVSIYKGLLWEKSTKISNCFQNFRKTIPGFELLFFCRQGCQDQFSTVFTIGYDVKFSLGPDVKTLKFDMSDNLKTLTKIHGNDIQSVSVSFFFENATGTFDVSNEIFVILHWVPYEAIIKVTPAFYQSYP